MNNKEEKEFDVFLSHNSVDKPWAIRIKEALESRGFKVWLDRDEIRPGDLFVGALEAGLENSKTVALLVSPESIQSGWVKEEYSRALSLAQLKTQPLQLIPVVLRETDLPGFLASRNWVDFRDESTFEKSLIQLIFGITGRKDTIIQSERVLNEATIPDFERYIGGETAYRINQIVRDYTKLFVGRQQEIQKLDTFITQHIRTRMIVTAKAGFGKTALMANWISRQQGHGYFIAYHFFNHLYKEVTCPLVRGLRNLLRQLYIYYKASDLRLPEDEYSLRDAINGIINERGAINGPLILILDGLDEAERPFTPPFPSPLPEDILVIATARADLGEVPEYLKGWVDDAELLHLDNLPNIDIRRWVENVGDSILAAFAHDDNFITQVNDKTEGFPLYLHFLLGELIEAVNQRQDIWEVLNRIPRGFGTYVKQQFGLLAQVKDVQGEPKIQELFALLAVAKGPLTADEVQDLTGLNAWALNDLPWQVTRWFTTLEQLDTSTYAFANSILADEFKRALGRQARQTEKQLLDYCARWSELNNTYPLQYFAEHLKDAQLWEQLFHLARDTNFRQAQLKAYPETPDLPLRTIRLALQGATEANGGEAMAEFVLTHARFAAKIEIMETPFDAFKDGNTAKALRLADSYDDPVPVLWNLLIIWLLHRSGNTVEAARIFRGLTTIRRPRLSYWMADVAATLFSLLDDFPAHHLLTAARRLLGPYHLRILVLSLTLRGTNNSLSIATQTIPLIRNLREKQKALVSIAVGLAKAGHWDKALNQVNLLEDAWTRTWALSDLSFIALQQKNMERAEKIVWELEIVRDDLDRDGGWLDLNWQLAKAMANLAVYYFYYDQEKSLALLNRIREIADKTYRYTFKSRVLGELAKAYALLEQSEAAQIFFSEALKVADKIYQPREKARSFAYIGRAYSKAGMRDNALKTFATASSIAQRIPEQMARAEVFEELAKDYLYEGELDSAIETLGNISNRGLAVKVLAELAKILVMKGELNVAYELANNKREWISAWILSEIGIGLINQGLVTEAIDTWVRSFSQVRIIHGENPSLPVIQALADFARAYLDSGDQEMADEMLKLALARAEQTKDQKKRIWHSIDITRALGAGHSLDLPSRLLAKAYSETKSLMGTRTKVWLLSQTAATAYKLNQTALADKIFSEAEELVEGIADAQEKATALCRIGEALAWAGKGHLAKVFLEKAQNVAALIGLWGIRITVLSHVALAYAKSEMIEEAKYLANNRDVSSRQDGHKALALIYSSEGNTVEAIKEARRIGNTKGQAQALRYVAVNEAKCGRIQEALDIAEIIISTRDTEFHPVEIPRITRAIMETGDLSCFKKLLIPNAYRIGSAYFIVGQIARLYPTEVSKIEELFMEFSELSLLLQQDEIQLLNS
jgi:hypothetical protein